MFVTERRCAADIETHGVKLGESGNPHWGVRVEGFKLGDINLVVDIVHLLTPTISSKSTNPCKFERLSIPPKMKERASDLDILESFVKPDQLKDGAISCQIPGGYHPRTRRPPTSDFATPPWMPSDA